MIPQHRLALHKLRETTMTVSDGFFDTDADTLDQHEEEFPRVASPAMDYDEDEEEIMSNCDFEEEEEKEDSIPTEELNKTKEASKPRSEFDPMQLMAAPLVEEKDEHAVDGDDVVKETSAKFNDVAVGKSLNDPFANDNDEESMASMGSCDGTVSSEPQQNVDDEDPIDFRVPPDRLRLLAERLRNGQAADREYNVAEAPVKVSFSTEEQDGSFSKDEGGTETGPFMAESAPESWRSTDDNMDELSGHRVTGDALQLMKAPLVDDKKEFVDHNDDDIAPSFGVADITLSSNEEADVFTRDEVSSVSSMASNKDDCSVSRRSVHEVIARGQINRDSKQLMQAPLVEDDFAIDHDDDKPSPPLPRAPFPRTERGEFQRHEMPSGETACSNNRLAGSFERYVKNKLVSPTPSHNSFQGGRNNEFNYHRYAERGYPQEHFMLSGGIRPLHHPPLMDPRMGLAEPYLGRAMEKLSDSMRRSELSRSYIQHLRRMHSFSGSMHDTNSVASPSQPRDAFPHIGTSIMPPSPPTLPAWSFSFDSKRRATGEFQPDGSDPRRMRVSRSKSTGALLSRRRKGNRGGSPLQSADTGSVKSGSKDGKEIIIIDD